MRIALSLFLFPVLGLAQPIPSRTVLSSTHFPYSQVNLNGDTNRYTAWSPCGKGGPWPCGARLYGTTGDAAFGAYRGHMMLMEMKSYDPASISGTVVNVVNPMPSYGQPGEGHCMSDPDASKACSSGLDLFFLNGKLYWFVQVQYNGAQWQTYREILIVSPEENGTWGAHWCNLAHYLAGDSVLGPNSCGPSNWNADGDAPRNLPAGCTLGVNCTNLADAAVQWMPAGGPYDPSGKMGRMTLVQINQDGTAPPAIPGVDTSYLYFISNRWEGGSDNSRHTLYAHRVSKSSDPMLPGSWQHYRKTDRRAFLAARRPTESWVGDKNQATDIMPAAWSNSNVFSQGAMYDPCSQLFFMVVSNDRDKLPMATSSAPWGPWNPMPPIQTAVTVGDQFAQFILPTYQAISANHWTIAVAGNGSGADPTWTYVAGFTLLDFLLPACEPAMNGRGTLTPRDRD